MKDRDLQVAEKRLLGADAQVNELQARLNDTITQRKYWEGEYNVSLATDTWGQLGALPTPGGSCTNNRIGPVHFHH